MNKTIEFLKVFTVKNNNRGFCAMYNSKQLTCLNVPEIYCEICIFNRDPRDPIQAMTHELVTDYESKTDYTR